MTYSRVAGTDRSMAQPLHFARVNHNLGIASRWLSDLRSQILHHWLTGCAFQFARTVSGAAPTAGSELIKKRSPSGEAAY